MTDLLKSGQVDHALLCELAAHPDFPRLMDDLEIYVRGRQANAERNHLSRHYEHSRYQTA